MSEVYVVTKGDYSSYHIKGVFSTKEMADRFLSNLQDSDATIETYVLDELDSWPNERKSYYVWFDRDGNGDALDESPRKFDERVIPNGNGTHMHTYCWARDEEHAVKIANERRAQTIAAGDWETDWHKWHEREKARGTIQ
jgi:hypothetical protein